MSGYYVRRYQTVLTADEHAASLIREYALARDARPKANVPAMSEAAQDLRVLECANGIYRNIGLGDVETGDHPLPFGERDPDVSSPLLELADRVERDGMASAYSEAGIAGVRPTGSVL